MGFNQAFLRRTFELAKFSREQGNHPFGALLVIGDEIVLEEVNTVCDDEDFTRHAELNLVVMASKKFSVEELARATLYSSTEPCKMCAGAIFWAGIGGVVYGCSAKVLSEYAPYPADTIKYAGPFLESEARMVHENFW